MAGLSTLGGVRQWLTAAACAVGVLAPNLASAQTTPLFNTGVYKSNGAALGARGVDATNNGVSADDFWVYCIDPSTGFGNGATYTVISGLDNYLINLVNGRSLTYYKEEFSTGAYSTANSYGDLTDAATVKARLDELFRYAYADSLTSTVKSAAFQFSVWEVLGDAALSRTAGFNTKDDAAINGQIDSYLGALNSHTWGSLTATNYNFTIYMSLNTSQGQIRVTPQPGGGSAPEPGSVLLAALGGVGLLASRRKTKRQGTVA